MCKTTTPPRPAAQDDLRKKLPPNTTDGAVIPLAAYLKKYVTQFSNELVPATAPKLDSDIDPNAYKRVAFSIQPLLATKVSPYYGGIFDDDTDFSASLVKVAALFSAGQMLSEAKALVAGASSAASFMTDFNNALKAEIDADDNTDDRIKAKVFPTGSPVGLYPHLNKVLQATGFGTSGGPTVSFQPTFNSNLSDMITVSSDPGAAFVIDQLGYGYISMALKKEGFFERNQTPGPDATGNTGRGIWLAGDYANPNTYIRIPCINDHPDAQLTTTQQMARMFARIWL